jgi:L-amino acid N-acyltransferase YncA
MGLDIVAMQADDWESVRQIYGEGIASGNATFEIELPDWTRWDHAHRKDCRLVAREAKTVMGWAALSPVSSRAVYAGVAEVSVYVATAAHGRGIGTALLRELVRQSEQNGIWTLQAGIFPENVVSITLHKSCGFREVGLRHRIAQLAGVWRDVLLLERRSSRVGV